MNKIKWGIVGTGAIAHRFANALQNVDSAILTAVASRSEDTSLKFANEFNIPYHYSSYEAMAKSDIDAVYIATPHAYHFPCAEMYIKEKKNILCEKPITVTPDELEKLMDLAKENDVFLMEALWTRFLPAVQKAKEMVDSGIIGDIRGVRADFCYHLPINSGHHVFDIKCGGGAILDVGVYSINFSCIFLGSAPKEILSTAYIGRTGVDQHTKMIFTYENGAIADLSCALSVRKPNDGFIYGTKGYIYLPEFYRAQTINVHLENGEQHNYTYNYIGNGFEEQIIECNDCITQGKKQSDVMPLAESLKITEIMHKIRKDVGVISCK